jgi:tetratricopeptide (TPR) repeat protein
LLAAGCGDPDLWARFRAERGAWQVERELQRIRIEPRLATDADYARAEAACRAVMEEFPREVWADPARIEDPLARDVAAEAGRAALALGRIAEMRGDSDEALRRYEDALAGWGALPEIALQAALARARVHDAAGRTAEAAAAWSRVAAAFDPLDESGRVLDEVLEAPRRAAALERELGRAREAEAALRAGIARLERLAADESDPARAAAWWEALAEDHAAAGDMVASLEAGRRALEAAPPGRESERLRLELARTALSGGQPDSARAMVAPLRSTWRLEHRLAALILIGRAFAAQGQVDSAMAAWDRVADDHPNAADAAAEARWLRGSTLQAAGRWEEARTEYRALAATYPAHRLAMRAMGRIVEYHARRGQTELARLEGLRAIEVLDRLILRQRDLDVQFEARLMRALLLEAVGPADEACEALTAFWRRYPRSYDGQEAGLRAAAIADSALHDRQRAADLYREMDGRPIRTAVRERVRSALAALEE